MAGVNERGSTKRAEPAGIPRRVGHADRPWRILAPVRVLLVMALVALAGALLVAAGCGGSGGQTCPATIPSNGASCDLQNECGYTTETNPCGAVDCSCTQGAWLCAPNLRLRGRRAGGFWG